MIGAESNLIKLTDEVKLFSIQPNESEKKELKKMFHQFSIAIPQNVNMSINFFKDGENIHGEALIGHQNVCVLARNLGENLIEVAESIKKEIHTKFIKSNAKVEKDSL